MGEECDYHFVSSVLELAIEQWNIAVERLRVMLEDPQHLLQELQRQWQDDMSEGLEPEQAVDKLKTSLSAKLCQISMKPTHDNFLTMGFI